MPGAAERLMDVDAFLAWCERREGRFELVDGVIVAMTGATKRHDRIVVNILTALSGRLRGKPCQPYTADMAVRTRSYTIRRPDVTVDCGEQRNDALEADLPTAVFEVLSPSTRQTDLVRKLDEYRALKGLRHVVLIEQAAAAINAYARASDDQPWDMQALDGLDGAIELGALGFSLPLTEVYADVTFDEEP